MHLRSFKGRPAFEFTFAILAGWMSLAAWQAPAMAQSVTSFLDVDVPPNERFNRTLSAATGALADEFSMTGLNGLGSAKTSTRGISFITLPSHPGKIFIHTEPFTAEGRGTAGSDNNTPGGYDNSTLTRNAIWRFAALKPQYQGTDGTLRLTFKWSWNLQQSYTAFSVTGPCQASLILRSDVATSKSLDPSMPASDSGSEFWTTDEIPFTFGMAMDGEWSLRATAGAVYRYQSQVSSTAQLWKVEVLDQAGQPLTRFSDYEWYELSDNSDEATIHPVATGEMVSQAFPDLRCSVNGQTFVVDWDATSTLALYASSTLQPGSWSPVTQPVVTVANRKKVEIPISGSRQFFQLRSTP